MRQGGTGGWKGGQAPRLSDAEAADHRAFQAKGSARRDWDDRRAPQAIMGHYSRDFDTKDFAPHEAGGCKASYCWNRFHAAALRIAWHNGGPRWGAILAILASTPLQNGQRGGSLFRAGGMR